MTNPRHKASVHQGSRTIAEQISPRVVSGGLVALVLLAPLFRGLFFQQEQLIALTAILILFVFWWWTKYQSHDMRFLQTPAEYAGLILVGGLLLSTFVALNVRDAVQEVLKNTAYLVVFWLTLELTRSDADRRRLLVAIFVAGVVLAAVSFLTAAGTIIFTGAVIQGRLASSLQYPNALAAYLAVSTLLGLTLSAQDQARWSELAFLEGSSVSLLAFVFTFSRTTWLLFPVAVVGLILLVPGTYRLRLVAHSGVSVVAAAVGVPLFSMGLAHTSAGLIWGAVALTLVLAVAGMYLADTLVSARRVYKVGFVVIMLAAVAVGTLVLARHLPQDLRQRIAAIGYGSHDLQERLQLMRDAMKMVRDSLPLGAGGGGFAAAYHAYQGYGYTSTQVHNYYIQVLLEAGPLGLLAVLFLWGSTLFTYFKCNRGAGLPTRLLSAGALAAGLALGVHSALDFDLSLASLSLVLWILWAVVLSLEPRPPAGSSQTRAISAVPALLAVAVSLGLAVFALRLWTGARVGQRAMAEYRSGKVAAAQQDYQTAVSLDPFSATSRIGLATVEETLAASKRDNSLLLAARTGLETGLRLESTNPDVEAAYAAFLIRHGEIDSGLQAFERALKLQPFQSVRYENLAEAYVFAGETLLQQGQSQKADRVLQKVLPLGEALAARHRQAPTFAYPWESPPEATPRLSLCEGQALALLGQSQAAEPLLSVAAGDKSVAAEAELWLGILASKRGDAKAQHEMLAKAYAANPALKSDFQILETLVP